jgi:hypothetical protein
VDRPESTRCREGRPRMEIRLRCRPKIFKPLCRSICKRRREAVIEQGLLLIRGYPHISQKLRFQHKASFNAAVLSSAQHARRSSRRGGSSSSASVAATHSRHSRPSPSRCSCSASCGVASRTSGGAGARGPSLLRRTCLRHVSSCPSLPAMVAGCSCSKLICRLGLLVGFAAYQTHFFWFDGVACRAYIVLPLASSRMSWLAWLSLRTRVQLSFLGCT